MPRSVGIEIPEPEGNVKDVCGLLGVKEIPDGEIDGAPPRLRVWPDTDAATERELGPRPPRELPDDNEKPLPVTDTEPGTDTEPATDETVCPTLTADPTVSDEREPASESAVDPVCVPDDGSEILPDETTFGVEKVAVYGEDNGKESGCPEPGAPRLEIVDADKENTGCALDKAPLTPELENSPE